MPGYRNVFNCCHHCNQDLEGIEIVKCSRCKKVSYCSKECKSENWNEHNDECSKNIEVVSIVVCNRTPDIVIQGSEGNESFELNCPKVWELVSKIENRIFEECFITFPRGDKDSIWESPDDHPSYAFPLKDESNDLIVVVGNFKIGFMIFPMVKSLSDLTVEKLYVVQANAFTLSFRKVSANKYEIFSMKWSL